MTSRTRQHLLSCYSVSTEASYKKHYYYVLNQALIQLLCFAWQVPLIVIPIHVGLLCSCGISCLPLMALEQQLPRYAQLKVHHSERVKVLKKRRVSNEKCITSLNIKMCLDSGQKLRPTKLKTWRRYSCSDMNTCLFSLDRRRTWRITTWQTTHL